MVARPKHQTVLALLQGATWRSGPSYLKVELLQRPQKPNQLSTQIFQEQEGNRVQGAHSQMRSRSDWHQIVPEGEKKRVFQQIRGFS